MNSSNIEEVVIAALVNAGVKQMFVNHGTSTVGFAAQNGVTQILSPNEYGGGAAAIGTSLAINRPGVLLATNSVGFFSGGAAFLDASKSAGLPAIYITVSDEPSAGGFQTTANIEMAARSTGAEFFRVKGGSALKDINRAFNKAYTGTGKQIVLCIDSETSNYMNSSGLSSNFDYKNIT